ncbi:MAG: hypothetical protein ACOYBT_09795 [Polynucleobacter sp.]
MATARDAVIGDNLPPEPTPIEVARETITSLDAEAANWFDGEPIANQGQADDVARLLDAARKAKTRFDADRKAEKAPHDQAAKAVDATWKPLLADADRIVEVAKAALTPWQIEQDRIKREAEAKARADAEAAAAEARRLAEQNNGTLAAAKARDAAIEEAKRTEARATAASNDKAVSKGEGMARAVSLRTTWRATVDSHRTLLNHVATNAPADLTAFLDEWAARAVRMGARDLPGVTVWQERAAA